MDKLMAALVVIFLTSCCACGDPDRAYTCREKGSWPLGMTDSMYPCSKAEFEARQ